LQSNNITFALGTRYTVTQDAPEEQRSWVQVSRAPGRGNGGTAQLAALFFRQAFGQQVLAQAIFTHRSPAHATCNSGNTTVRD